MAGRYPQTRKRRGLHYRARVMTRENLFAIEAARPKPFHSWLLLEPFRQMLSQRGVFAEFL
jgi:hypothetical protein